MRRHRYQCPSDRPVVSSDYNSSCPFPSHSIQQELFALCLPASIARTIVSVDLLLINVGHFWTTPLDNSEIRLRKSTIHLPLSCPSHDVLPLLGARLCPALWWQWWSIRGSKTRQVAGMQQRKWAIVCGSSQFSVLSMPNLLNSPCCQCPTSSILRVVNAQPPLRCHGTANPSAETGQRLPAEPRLVRPCW